MPVIDVATLKRLQEAPESIRNICILAHVDHGKTSLTDALIATNGIISPKLAGKIRYLDSRPDEQLRGITMESSAISLYFSLLKKSLSGDQPKKNEYLINLIDSPGHVDFSSEVSVASRLCDGAVVLVDAVEGVCSQTVAVLRQTWMEKLKPLLVINKMDRLITETKMSPLEAYTHLKKIVEQVNAVMGAFFQGERMEDDLNYREVLERKTAYDLAEKEANRGEANPDVLRSESTDAHTFEEKDDDDIYFSPDKSNVIFSSATDGWAFTIKQFAGIYERKLGIKSPVLEKVLWGDYYLDPKTKRVLGSKHLKGRPLKPMFVQLVLENIWSVYNATLGGSQDIGDSALLEKITSSLSITLSPHVLRSRDHRNRLTGIFSAWLPLSTALLVSIVEKLPAPPTAQESRMPAIMNNLPGASAMDSKLREAMTSFTSLRSNPTIAYVSKMITVADSYIAQRRQKKIGALSAEEARNLARIKREEVFRNELNSTESTNKNEVIDKKSITGDKSQQEQDIPKERLIGFARLYAGRLQVGDYVYVISPKYNALTASSMSEPPRAQISSLYLLMGRELEPLDSVPAGVIFGIGGLENHVQKSATLSSQGHKAISLAGVSTSIPPILRVALEPTDPRDLQKMTDGLKILEQSDPCATYEVLESGEHVMLTAGELHLERCLKDLKERFARCDIQVGEPTVPYRESLVSSTDINPLKEDSTPRGLVTTTTPSNKLKVQMQIRPLPNPITEFLKRNTPALRILYSQRKVGKHISKPSEEELASDLPAKDEDDSAPVNLSSEELSGLFHDFSKKLNKVVCSLEHDRTFWLGAVGKIASFGPKRVGPNMLIDSTSDGLFAELIHDHEFSWNRNDHDGFGGSTFRDLAGKISYAFQLAMSQGPLCGEPVQGVAVFIQSLSFTKEREDEENRDSSNVGSLTGEILKTVRDSIRQGFLDWSPRLLLAMYSCEIQASLDVLGKVSSVITRRRGRILSDTMREGTPFYTIVALLPVADSFGFSEEIRKRTSGAAFPQLVFHGFEMLDEDPFWTPFTEDEIEDLGELADRENVAKNYMDRVRRRKGLHIAGKKLVESAEKQRTLKK